MQEALKLAYPTNPIYKDVKDVTNENGSKNMKQGHSYKRHCISMVL